MRLENEDYLSSPLVIELFDKFPNWFNEQGYILIEKENIS